MEGDIKSFELIGKADFWLLGGVGLPHHVPIDQAKRETEETFRRFLGVLDRDGLVGLDLLAKPLKEEIAAHEETAYLAAERVRYYEQALHYFKVWAGRYGAAASIWESLPHTEEMRARGWPVNTEGTLKNSGIRRVITKMNKQFSDNNATEF